jgi:hypothetical protein
VTDPGEKLGVDDGDADADGEETEIGREDDEAISE